MTLNEKQIESHIALMEKQANPVSMLERATAFLAVVLWMFLFFLIGGIISGCAMTSTVTRSGEGENATELRSRAFVTSGSKITGKDLSQTAEVNKDGTWKVSSGERTDSMESSTEAMLAFFRFASAIAPIAFPAPGPPKPSTFQQIDINAIVAAAIDAYRASQE